MEPIFEQPQQTFNDITNVDMHFGSVRNAQGEKIPLTQSSLYSFLIEPDRQVREEAFTKYYNGFSKYRDALADTLAAQIQDDAYLAQTRKYSSSIEAALFAENIPLSVYDTLIATVHAQLPLLQRYFALRKRILNLKELHPYDLYTPLVPDVQKTYTFDEAITTVIAALQPLGSDYTSVLENGLRNERWCDRYPNQGKESGGFTCPSYGVHPYILVNFEGTLEDVYTLAHESGHAMHDWYSEHHQSFQNYACPTFIAEVASQVNEMLLSDYLLKKTTDPKTRAFIFNRQLDELRSALFSQTLFAEFEKATHAAADQGTPLTLDFFETTYAQLLNTYMSPAVTVDDICKLGCLTVPHFYIDFYVYQYATGISAAVTLATKLVTTADKTSYLDFLKSGGSHYAIDTLQRAGVDMRTAAPIETTLTLFKNRLDELEKLLASMPQQ